MRLSEQAKSDINWWLENIDTIFATDSSDGGWGVVFENKRTGDHGKKLKSHHYI